MRRTKEDSEKTRTTILQAAETLFLKNGVSHTSLEQIARAAGVTRGAVYWHFQNKPHLFNELLDQIRLPVEQVTGQLMHTTQSDPLKLLCQHCVQALENLVLDERRRRILNILIFHCEFNDDMRDAEALHNAFIQSFINLFERIFAREDCRTRLRSGLTPGMAARILHAFIHGLIQDWLRNPQSFDPMTDSHRLIEPMFYGLISDWESSRFD